MRVFIIQQKSTMFLMHEINNFIKGKQIKDIKYCINENCYEPYTAMIIYEE